MASPIHKHKNSIEDLSIFLISPTPHWIRKALRYAKLIVLIQWIFGFCYTLSESHAALEEQNEQYYTDHTVIDRTV